mgnify:CR=1 FL=1
MGYGEKKVSEIVKAAVEHSWSVPEFQRGFVWKSTQVRDLAESLWRGFPVGSLLLWQSDDAQQVRTAVDSKGPSEWLVDGQQRVTALCILAGRKPYWWSSTDEWNQITRRYDVRFDVEAQEAPYFRVADGVIRRASRNRYVPVADLVTVDVQSEKGEKALLALAARIKEEGYCADQKAETLFVRLQRVARMAERSLVTISVDHDLEDVVEIFTRLNGKGTRVTEADIYLGLVASKNPGWVRETFLPYLKTLEESGFAVDPNLLFRSLTAIGTGRVRFREIDDAFWTGTATGDAWRRTTSAWTALVSRLRDYGVLSNHPMPTETALVTLLAFVDRFGAGPEFAAGFYWFLQASRVGRYSGSATTSLEEDLREVREAASALEAVRGLLRRLRLTGNEAVTTDEFLRDYSDSRFGRFLLYLLAWNRSALDWSTDGLRLGFDRTGVLSGFRPQWHHVFPRKFLEGAVPEPLIEALANIAVIGPSANISIGRKDPMDYLREHAISDEKLGQQLIQPGIRTCTKEGYPEWLTKRAERLADAANGFLASLAEPHGLLERE